jgi:transcriptional regulator with XRE-family HTH domain
VARRDGHFEAKGGGFMGRKWDAFVPGPRTWREVFRVLKPGGHIAAFAGTRTWDAMAIALRLAGFELRDTLQWLYGSGFPKSMAVDKAIDRRKDWRALAALQHAIRAARKALGITQSEAARRAGMIGPDERLGGGGYMWFETGMRLPTREQWPGVKAALGLADEYDAAFEAAEREVVGRVGGAEPGEKNLNVYAGGLKSAWDVTAPATDDARDWEGWGTALKPAWEPILLMRKPLAERTVAAQVLATATGALHIAACRVGTDDTRALASPTALGVMNDDAWKAKPVMAGSASGRWPANLVLSHTWQCVPAGTKRVRASWNNGGPAGRSRNGTMFNFSGDARAFDYADPDGMETVEAWDCAPGCPVAELDRQSGTARAPGSIAGNNTAIAVPGVDATRLAMGLRRHGRRVALLPHLRLRAQGQPGGARGWAGPPAAPHGGGGDAPRAGLRRARGRGRLR